MTIFVKDQKEMVKIVNNIATSVNLHLLQYFTLNNIKKKQNIIKKNILTAKKNLIKHRQD